MASEMPIWNQPSHSALRRTRRKTNGAAWRYLWPSAYSRISNGTTAVAIAMKYGMRNAPPPFSYTTYG